MIECCQHSPDRSYSFEAQAIRQRNQCVGFHKKNFQYKSLPDVYRTVHISKLDKFLHHNPVRISPWTFSVQFIKPCLIDYKINLAQYIFFKRLKRDLFQKQTVVKKKVPSRSNSMLQNGMPEALAQDFTIEESIACHLRNCDPQRTTSERAVVPSLESNKPLTIEFRTSGTHIIEIRELFSKKQINMAWCDNNNSSLLYLACEHLVLDVIPLFLSEAKKQKVPLTSIKRKNMFPVEHLENALNLRRNQENPELIQKIRSAIELIKSFQFNDQ